MKKNLCYLLILFSLLILSCGRKSAPQLKAFEKPERVENLKAIHNEKGIIISWSYPERKKVEIKGFIIVRSEGRDFERIGYSVDKDNPTFVDRDFKIDTSYRYRVIAEGIKGVLSDASELSVTPASLPEPPKNIRFLIKNDLIELSWDDKNRCYNVYRAYQDEEYSRVNKKPVCDSIFTDHISPERPVHYIVRSTITTDILNEGPPSKKVTVGLDNYIPSQPKDLRIIIGNQKVFLLWKESPEIWVKGYRIYRRSEEEKDFRLIGETSIPGFTDSNLTGLQGKRLFYMIKALGPIVESEPLVGDCFLLYPERVK